MERMEQRSPSPEGSPHEPDSLQRLAALEGIVGRVVDAFDKNTGVYGDGFRSIDASLYVLMRVQQDIFLIQHAVKFGEELLVLRDKDGQLVGIDYDAYLKEYWCCVMMAEAVEPLHQKFYPKERSTVSEESSEPDLVFGGGP
jgi:hypothetical protein